MDPFGQVLTALGIDGAAPPYVTTASVCDTIVQMAHACFPDIDIDTFDTLAWHARVQQDLAREHTGDEATRDAQLFRNLPAAVTARFEDASAMAPVLASLDAVAARNASLRVASAVQLDRSRLSVVPVEVLRLLTDNLPAVSIFAVIAGLDVSDETKKSIMLHLMDRDIFEPLRQSPVSLLVRTQMMLDLRAHYARMSLSKILVEYKLVTEQVANALIGTAQRTSKVHTNFSFFRFATTATLEGRFFALTFKRIMGKWKAHTVADKRIFAILPDSLGVAIRDFSVSAASVTHDNHVASLLAFETLVKLVVQTIDPSVGWRVELAPEHLWPTLVWPSTQGVYPYSSMPNEVIANSATGYRTMAARSYEPVDATRLRPSAGMGVSTTTERLLD